VSIELEIFEMMSHSISNEFELEMLMKEVAISLLKSEDKNNEKVSVLRELMLRETDLFTNELIVSFDLNVFFDDFFTSNNQIN
jgi:hypothetical protein